MSVRFQKELGRRSWGRVVEAVHSVGRPDMPGAVPAFLAASMADGGTGLAFGLGRSYGDSNLNAGGHLIDMTRLDRLIRFDREAGILHAEAGASLNDILHVIVPAGYFLPTTPGTRYVTVGGAIANNVHGKNHHSAGSFGRHVHSLTLARSDGSVRRIGPDTEPDLFAATVGGLGLTGIILDAEIALVPIRSAYIDQTIEPVRHVRHFLELAEVRARTHEHTVAWIDCTARGQRLGQGVFTSGNWAYSGGLDPHRASGGPALPFDAPSLALNALSLRGFNLAYRQRQLTKQRSARVHYAGFFHPLDTIGQWNRLYGPRGFYQYQSVVPFAAAEEATTAMLARIAASGEGSFLAVLKTFGALASPGRLSFPAPGVTLALDFANRGAKTLALLADLDAIVREAGGRLYPAKDGRMPAAMFQAGYPDWEKVEALRDPAINSDFWRRVTRHDD